MDGSGTKVNPSLPKGKENSFHVLAATLCSSYQENLWMRLGK